MRTAKSLNTITASKLVQPRIRGQRRQPRGTALLAAIDAAVDAECHAYGVSRSYVLACCAAVALNVKLDPALLYRPFPSRRKR